MQPNVRPELEYSDLRFTPDDGKRYEARIAVVGVIDFLATTSCSA